MEDVFQSKWKNFRQKSKWLRIEFRNNLRYHSHVIKLKNLAERFSGTIYKWYEQCNVPKYYSAICSKIFRVGAKVDCINTWDLGQVETYLRGSTISCGKALWSLNLLLLGEIH